MKYPKILLCLLSGFVSFQSLVAQETTPPPPDRAPGPPGEGVPIDQGIWFMLIAAVWLGVYVILKQNNIAMKNVLPKKLKNFFFVTAFLLMNVVGWGQGSETFELASLPSSYSDGSFVGDNSVTWNYIQSRDDAGYEITNEGIMLRRSSDGSKVYSESVAGGIGDFTCKLKKAYTGSGNRQVELFINGVSKGTSIAWDNTNVQTFSVGGINAAGNIVVEIRNITSKQVVVDDISWTGYSAGPTITTTPTSLTGFTYVEGNGPSAEQSFTVEGTNLTADITVTPPTNWEISLTSGGSFQTTPITLTQSGGSVASTTIFTRMVAGLLNANSPFSGNIACESSGATTQNVVVDGTVTLPCAEPNQATNITFPNTTASAIDVSFTAASPAADAYLVVQNTSSSLSATPVDGTSYAVNDALGGGTVVFNGAGTSFTDSGLTSNTTYYYFVFAYNNTDCSGGPNYNTTSLDGNDTTLNGPVVIYEGGFEDGDESWTYYSAGGTSDWVRENDGGTYSPGDNGHDGTYYAWFYGYNEDADDWLISPSYDFSSYTNIEMVFWSWMRNTGSNVVMKISSNYTSGDPTVATWVDLSPTLATSTETWTNSGNVVLGTFDGESNVHLAFYYSGSNVDRNWAIDDYSISGVLNNSPEIQITGNGQEILDGDATPEVADDTEFGNVEVSSGSVAHTFTINNTGGADLTINSITSSNSGEFAVSGTTSGTIAAGSSSTFTVTFDPSALGTRTATITVDNDDADEATYDFAVQGTGTNSAASDIIENASFSYTTNIDYLSYQADPITNSSHSIGVFGLTIRDGGGAADTDALATELTDLSFSYTGTANTIRAAALFDGNTHLTDATVTANGISFTGLSGADFTAPDDGEINVTLRVSFTTVVVDNEQLQFTITGATANAAGSVFATADAGGAQSAVTGDKNRIEVVADRLAFNQQPTDTNTNDTMSPSVTVQGVDVNANLDLDFTDDVSISSSGTMTGAPITVTASSGIATFSAIIHTVAGTGLTLTASHATFSSAVSDTFDITEITYNNGDYRTTGSGTWTSNDATPAIWERYDGSSWSAHNSPSFNTSNAIFIRNGHTIDTGGSFGSSVAINIMDGGTFRVQHSSTAASTKIYTGGSLKIYANFTNNGDFDVEDNAEVVIQYEYGNPFTSLWKGTENFHPNSNLIFKDYDCADDNLLLDDTSVTTNTYNGYTAAFGNIIIDFTDKLGASDDWIMLDSGITINMAHGDFIFRSNDESSASMRVSTTGTVTSGIGGDFIVENTYPGANNIDLKTSGTLTFTVKGNVELNAATLRVRSGSASGTSTLNIEGDLLITPSAVLNFNSSDAASPVSVVNLYGDLSVAGSGLLQNSNTSNLGQLNFVGTGDGLTPETTQTVDIASTSSNENKYIDFNVTSGAYVQTINQDFELGKNSKLTVKDGGTFDFGFNGTTALLVTKSGSQTGTGFDLDAGGYLKISSPDGLMSDSSSGNVQVVSSNTTFSPIATFHYIGKANQVTGDAVGSSPNGKAVIVELESNSLSLTPSTSFGFTNTTNANINGGNGGILDIRKGKFVETTTAYVTGSTGGLSMSDGTSYSIPKLSADASDVIPRVSGLSNTYTLSGSSTIELSGAGDQVLRGQRAYRNVTFSDSGIKTISSAPSSITGDIYITDDAIVDVEDKTMGGSGTNLLMDTNAIYRTAGTGTKPDAQGSYLLGDSSKIVFTNTVTTLESIRLLPDYMHIEIEGTNVGNASYLTGVTLQSGGTFTVKNGGVFKLKNEAGFTGSTTTAVSNENNPTVTLEAGSTVEFANDNGNDQTITLFTPYYANMAISGTGTKVLGDATDIVVNEDLFVNASKLLIQESKGITIQDAIQNEGEIEVLDTGSIVQVNEVDNNDNTGGKAGNYIIHRTTRPYMEYDYTYWSSPIENESFADAFDHNSSVVVPGGEPSNGDANSVMSRIFWFDTSDYEDTNGDGYDDDPNDNGCWRSVAPTDLMVKGKGYIAMGAGSDWPFNPDVGAMANGLLQSVFFDGNKIHNGSFAYPLVADANSGDPSNNENLVGNPYPSAIDLVALRNHAQNNPGGNPVMGSTVHFWSHDTQISYDPNHLWAYNFTNADYATYNIATQVGAAAHAGSPIPTQYLASCQSIIIEADTPDDLYIKNSMRVVAQNTNFFKSQETDKDALWLELTAENGLFRQITLVFMDGADDTVNDYDSARNLYPDEPDLYSLAPNDDTHLVIQGLSVFEMSKTVDLGIRMMEPGDYTISISQLKGVFESGQDIYLKDYKTGILHNLRQAYDFSVGDTEIGDVNDRFELHFVDETSMSIDNNAINSLVVYPNPSDGTFYFTWNSITQFEIKIYDLNTRLVYVDTLQSGKGVDLSALESGVYFVRINDGKYEISQKLILK